MISMDYLGAQVWIYFLGAASGDDVKIGYTSKLDLSVRVRQVNREQTTDERYYLLAAVRGDRQHEAVLKRIFAPFNKVKGGKTEYFEPHPALVGYIDWLREQDFTTIDSLNPREIVVDPTCWIPLSLRDAEALGTGRLAAAAPDRYVNDTLFELDKPSEDGAGGLVGTVWDWMAQHDSKASDFFTPTELVVAAARAMGGLDLDPAGHWIAYEAHRPALDAAGLLEDGRYTYYHRQRSAFDNPWWGRVWLNPPMGENRRWFEEIVHYVGTGKVEQVCMLLPAHALWPSKAAYDILPLLGAHVWLSPTPTYWGNSEERVGSNRPRVLAYIGPRLDDFASSLAAFGRIWGNP